jgi:hypothetical protein
MHPCKCMPVLASALVCLLTIAAPVSAQFPYGDSVRVDARITISIPSMGILGDETICYPVSCTYINWSDPITTPEGDWIETEMIELNLRGESPGLGPIDIRQNPEMPAPGQTEYWPPPDFPAESFFDVYFEIELPEALPGEILHNEAPVRIMSGVMQWPPLFESYESDPAVPIPLFNELGDPVGEITFWHQEQLPYYPPRAHINVPTDKYSNALKIEEGNPFVPISAELITNIEPEIISATFGWRYAGDPGPFTDFGFDTDGSAPGLSTIKEMGEGDGWSSFFDVNLAPSEGAEIEFEVEFEFSGPFGWPFGWVRDSIYAFVDPDDIFPHFWDFPRDSIGYLRPDSLYGIPVLYYDQWIAFMQLRVLPLDPDHNRPLTVVNQLGLGTPLDSVSCAPSAAASCLKYWADNGYPEIEHPGGDTSKPKMTPEDIARELQGLMGTRDSVGTTAGGAVDGIEDYLDNHNLDGWTVDQGRVGSADGLAEMFDEFEAEGEDVIILLEDTTASGKKVGHAVTMGSKSTSSYEVITDEAYIGCIRHNVDFMDPWGGGSTADNDYPVNYDENGRPTTSGYSLGGVSDAKIFGYIKVSPPEDGGGASLELESAEWIVVDSGTPSVPPGVPDTLYWNTDGFAGGVYLLEARTLDASGHWCRDIRLCGIPEYSVDADEAKVPGVGTLLRGSFPNPFNPTTTIKYSLAESGKVTLSVYDIAGRLVRNLLVNEWTEAGEHVAVWDGRNDAGVRVASGVYLCMMKTGGEKSGIKLILLR